MEKCENCDRIIGIVKKHQEGVERDIRNDKVGIEAKKYLGGMRMQCQNILKEIE
jgi:hypothetical protein